MISSRAALTTPPGLIDGWLRRASCFVLPPFPGRQWPLAGPLSTARSESFESGDALIDGLQLAPHFLDDFDQSGKLHKVISDHDLWGWFISVNAFMFRTLCHRRFAR